MGIAAVIVAPVFVGCRTSALEGDHYCTVHPIPVNRVNWLTSVGVCRVVPVAAIIVAFVSEVFFFRESYERSMLKIMLAHCRMARKNDNKWGRQAESWHRREVDLVRGFPFVSEVFFFRESYE